MGRTLKLRKVAITGGIASGKTAVCRVFQELGAFVVNADAITHELLSPNTALGKKIVGLFGSAILQDGKLNRHAIADIAFKDPELLHELEKLLHPAVLRKIEELYEQAQKTGLYSLFVLEIPLLYEIQQQDAYDTVLAVVTRDEIAKERFRKAGFSNEEWERRMKRQLPPHEKAIRADFVIHNDGTLDDLYSQVGLLNKRLSSHES